MSATTNNEKVKGGGVSAGESLLPKAIETLSPQVFSRCKGLTQVEIPASVRSIGADAFKGCTSLTSMVIRPSEGRSSEAGGDVSPCNQ